MSVLSERQQERRQVHWIVGDVVKRAGKQHEVVEDAELVFSSSCE